MAKLKSLPPKAEESSLVNLRVTAAEKRKIQAMANKYADGNVSHWIRYAAMTCVPRKTDLTA